MVVLVVLTVSLSFCLRAYKYNTTITKRAKLKNVRRCFVCGILGEFFVSSKRHKYTTSHKQTKRKTKLGHRLVSLIVFERKPAAAAAAAFVIVFTR